MKTFKNFNQKACFFLLFLTLLSIQCKNKSKSSSEIDPAFAGYISAFTSGIISNESSIVIQLRDAQPDVKSGQKIEENLFSFSPSIKGETFWKDSRTIEFQPKEPLTSDKLIECKFYLSKVIEVPRNLKVFEFQFQTIKQSIRLVFEGVKAYNHNDLKLQKLMGTLITADHAEDPKIEALFSAVQNGKRLKITWEHKADGVSHGFVVDSVKRSETKSEVILQWNGDIIDAEDGEKTIEIPALGDFKVIDFAIIQQPEQCITLFFSDPLKENQDLEGLIYLESKAEVKLMVSENEVKIFPVSRIIESTSVIVEKGVRNVMDYPLIERFQKSIQFSSLNPAVQLIGQGVILPSSNGLIFPFKAVNLSAINVKIIKIFEDNVAQFFQVNQYDGTNELKRVGRIVYKRTVALTSSKPIEYGKWNTFALDLSELIKVEPGAIYRVNISFDQKQSLYPCTENAEKTDDETIDFSEDKEITGYDNPQSYYYYDDYDYDYDDGYNWDEENDPCKKSYYLRNRHSVARNVFASDLGIIAKGGNGKSILVAVTDIKTTKQLSGVEVEIFNFQDQSLAKEQTNSDGLVTIDLETKPFLLVAKKDDQIGYLRLDDGSALSLSMFDVGGQENQKGLKGIIYGERGVWRPGDSLYISFVLEDKNQVIPENHPVVFELYTPENQLNQKKVKSNPVNGFYDFRTATATDAPTGNWLAKVKVGGSSFTKTLKIETIKPNRLKIKLDFHTKFLKNSNQLPGDLEVKWLHGAVAGNIKTDVVVKLQEGTTIFEKFPGFTFDNPSKKFESEEKTLFDGNLNAEGTASIKSDFSVNDNAPGMLKANFKIRAFETGGDFSVDQFTIPYSAYQSYVGLKIPKGPGWNGSLYSNEPNLIPIVSVDENGKPVNRSRVKIEIYEIGWRWWWEQSEEDDLAAYISSESSRIIKTDFVNTTGGKAMYEMNLGTNSWGRKLMLVTDPVSQHSAGALFYTSYKGWWDNPGQNNPGGAEMLTFSTDKDKYNVGEEVKVQLPENERGNAFISIESGSRIVQTFWFASEKGKTEFKFKTTPEMAPNVYVHITYIQPHNQMNNDLPIRLYGVQPIQVEDPETHLKPVIIMPDVLAPEENVTIKVKESNGKKMTYTLAIVDDGLLDLTRFKTPDPWNIFYAREALGVKTWDMYKYVMGAFTGELSGLYAIGGDEQITDKGSQKANRFKPVVKFIGPIELKASGTNTHTFKMPNYIGSVRTMIVAGNEGAYGLAEKTTPVKKPLMVLATLPRVVGPSESVKLPVTVFAMDPSIKNVTVEIQTNSFFKIINGNNKNITFAKEGDEVVYFDLEAVANMGIGRVKVIAKSGKEKAEYNIELNVRLPNPRITQVIGGVVDAGKTWSSDYKPVGIAGTNNGMIEVSAIPPINLENRLKYLIAYPHGCIEQTTSSVFPQLHLSSLVELTKEQKAQVEKNIIAGIERLRLFQLNSGGLSYWPGEVDEASDWGTNYAGHFMLEAQAEGYNLPSGFLKNWLKFQREKADDWTLESKDSYHHYYNSNQLIQAYRLYTLALAGKPALGAMNRMREITNLSIAAKWRLSAAYFLAGRTDVAKQLVNNLTTQVETYKEMSYSYGSSERDEAMILEALCLLDDRTNAKVILDKLAKELSSDQWYSTQATAYSLLAISKFIKLSGIGKGIEYTYKINDEKGREISTTDPVSQQKIPIVADNTGNIKIINNSKGPLFIKIELDGIPLIGDATSSENNLQMSIRYLGIKGGSFDESSVKQGTDFIAEVTVHNPGLRDDYKEMALTQIFPSGWEIRNLRMEESNPSEKVDVPRYQDIRDDRVYSYFDLRKNESKTYRILLNAAYLGKFYLPTVYCEAMYDNEINARRAGKWVEVVE